MTKIYLSGPMDAFKADEGKVWREHAKIHLAKWDIEAVNPYTFEQENARPTDLVREDLQHILSCQGLIANVSQDVRMVGTPMEILWAHMHHIPVVAFTGAISISPWLAAHAHVVDDLKTAVEILRWQTIRL